MTRFEIKDIISQDKKGIVFRAHDSEKRCHVALRRFFPFGQSGGGLSAEEATAFRDAAQRLDGVRHGSLRSVIAGSVDPIDGMPYIVAEWIDGAPLETVMDGGKLEAPHVIEVLWLALVVSLALSEVLGEESVWVETEADSIFVGSEESGRGFIFWLSPFKWLGAETGSRNLAAIAELGERLAGWKGKLVSDSAGNGLGGWLKWMRNNPDASLDQALQNLPTRVEGEVPRPQSAFVPPVTSSPLVVVKPPSSNAPIVIAIAAFLVVAIGGLAVYQRFAKTPSATPIVMTENAAEKADVEAEPAPETAAPKPSPKATQNDEDIAASRVNELAAKLAREKEAKRIAAKAPPAAKAPTPAPTPPMTLSPDAAQQLSGLKDETPVRISGILRGIAFASNGTDLYFDFSDPLNPNQIRCAAFPAEYKGKLAKEPFAAFIGKAVMIEGKKMTPDWNGGRPLVRVDSEKQVTVVK